MSQEASEILKGRSLVNRHLFQKKTTDTAEAISEQSSPTIYTNFDAELGLGRLRDSNGNISYGNPQTNGAIALGENIRLRRGGVLNKYDAMPSRKLQPITNITSNETFSFVALLSTGYLNNNIALTATKSQKIKVGIEPRTIYIDYAGGGLGGDTLTISYDGGSLTTEPTAEGGIGYSLELQYQPSENADGYLYLRLNSAYPNAGMGGSVRFNPIFYVCDGKKIKKLDYNTIYAEYGIPALPSVVGNKIYISFKENLPISTEHFRKITIFEFNRRSLELEDAQVFDYTDEDFISLPDNQDWRKSFTHSFLAHPPLDSVGCVNSYRESPVVHLDKDKKIINTAYFSGNLVTKKRITFQTSKFIPSTDRCTTKFKSKNITLGTTPEISAKSEYCTIIGLCVY
ncbi:MAG: hypothetical protein V7L22_23520 [Nostoc sp.]|uniref:hypothetical protein n=1 Tax=Nostoc sp. TaxID=1180 RepID=UPI002FF6F75C